MPTSSVVKPRTHYSVGHMVYLFLKDIYELGFVYVVRVHVRLKVYSVIES